MVFLPPILTGNFDGMGLVQPSRPERLAVDRGTRGAGKWLNLPVRAFPASRVDPSLHRKTSRFTMPWAQSAADFRLIIKTA